MKETGRRNRILAILPFLGLIFASSTTTGSLWILRIYQTAFFRLTPRDSTFSRRFYEPAVFIAEKGFHVAMFAAFALVLWSVLGDRARKASMVFVIGALVGALSEFLQRFFIYRDPTFRDFILNVAGTALGIAIAINASQVTAWSVALSFRVFRALFGGVTALLEGFWMGVLPDSVVDLVTEKSYGEGVAYANAEWIRSGFHFWEELAVTRYFPAGGRVLVAAAGGGREMVALEKAGFSADGFECSRAMVDAGRRTLAELGVKGCLQWAPPCAVPELDAVYDAAIVGWNGYTYMAPQARRAAFMEELRLHLHPGAPVLVSVAFRSGGPRTTLWTCRIANFVRRMTFRDTLFDSGAAFPGRPRHEFNRRQLSDELFKAGYSVTDYYRWGPFGAVVCNVAQDAVSD